MKIAVYPGSFDPPTYGHVNIVERSIQVFDKVIVAVATNSSKQTTFTPQERVEILRTLFEKEPRVEVDGFEGLLVDYVKKKKATAILRGLRTVYDFEFEFQMALANKKLDERIDTVFMMTDAKYAFYSSSIIKEIVRLAGETRGMLPPIVEERLKKKIYSKKGR
ncbi:MAG: pantetheine-phosphate adenylyltransferase [Deltaproteobacteria bacterium]|nr:pantetheine-phosphate adenylyltransferase [Deltaproteobacteria bacterium]